MIKATAPLACHLVITVRSNSCPAYTSKLSGRLSKPGPSKHYVPRPISATRRTGKEWQLSRTTHEDEVRRTADRKTIERGQGRVRLVEEFLLLSPAGAASANLHQNRPLESEQLMYSVSQKYPPRDFLAFLPID